MAKIAIGIIKEGKIPVDRRVPLSPRQARQVQDEFEGVTLFCQRSPIRCFSDEEYREEGIRVVDDVSHCDILLGIKEVPVQEIIPGKTYFFFSHTIKKQTYNRILLREILKKNVRLIDYECLTDGKGQRLIAFGRYAGIVGAYNGILVYGRKYALFNLRRAKDCLDLRDLKTEFKKVRLPAIKIAMTGRGRVANGAREVLDGMGIAEVTPEDFCRYSYRKAVYTQLSSKDYHFSKNGTPFNREEFYRFPERYSSDFEKYTREADLLIAAAYWNPMSPVLFTRNDMLRDDFSVRVIADITCDIEGSIPSTVKPSTIDDPVYDYDPRENKAMAPYSKEGFVTVMAIDNLPNELPRDASADFGQQMIKKILPALLEGDREQIIERATLTENGRLTPRFVYLRDFVDAG